MASNTQASPSAVPGSESKTSIISQGTQMQGEFQTSEHLRVDGEIKGDIQCSKRLVIGVKGRVIGNINAAEIIINGILKGEAHSQGKLTLGSSSKSEGKITALQLVVEEGALFNGQFSIVKV